MKTKILKIADIVFDKELYPRENPNWITSLKYANAMKIGSVFPPICVSLLEGKYYLVDGMHRITAAKNNKEKHISAEVLNLPDKRAIFIEAVKRNVTHGITFSAQEISNIAITLEQWKMSKSQISQIVKMPVNYLVPFIAKRSVLITDSRGHNTRIGLKSTLSNLANSNQNVDFENTQEQLSGRRQIQVIDDLVLLLQNEWVDLKDTLIVNQLINLKALLLKLPLPSKLISIAQNKTKKK